MTAKEEDLLKQLNELVSKKRSIEERIEGIMQIQNKVNNANLRLVLDFGTYKHSIDVDAQFAKEAIERYKGNLQTKKQKCIDDISKFTITLSK